MNTDKSLLEAQNQPSCLGAVMHWAAVSETKPEIGQWLLVYAPTGRHIAWYNGFQFDDRADYNIEGVTHWMQIPEPPCA